MLNNFIYVQTKALFEEHLLAGNILDEAVVFIEDTKEIWNHGTYFGGADVSKLENSIEGLSEAITALQSGKQDTITDLETIRTNANKGATALQSFTETDPIFAASVAANIKESDITNWNSKTSNTGTVTGIKINGFTKSPSSSGTVDIGSVATSVKINGQSKSPSSGVVDLGYINKQLSTSTLSSMSLSPNIYYRNINLSLSSLTITLGSVSNSNILNEYFVEFTTRSSGTTVSFPSDVKWVNGSAPTFDPGCTYQVSIVNNLGTYIKFA